jgi:hypothetical protein
MSSLLGTPQHLITNEMEKGNIPVSNLAPLMQQTANYCTKKLNPSLFK